MAPRVTPAGRINWSKTSGAAHCTITKIAITPAAGSAQRAASARHAMATVAAARIVKIVSAAVSCTLPMTSTVAANKYAPMAPEETSSIFPGSAVGPNNNPETINAAASAKPAMT